MMRAFLIAVAVVVGLVVLREDVGFGQGKPAAAPSIEGVWRVTSVITTGTNAANSLPNRQPNINIWTKKHYVRVTSDGPVRPVLPPPKDPAKLTESEKLARYEHWRQFAAAGGTYEVKGMKFFQQPLVALTQTDDIIARNAGRPTPDAPLAQDITFEGSKLVIVQTTADGKNVNRRTYERLDQPSAAKPHPIEGVWKLASTVITGDGASANPSQQPNVYVYKGGYYGFVTQDGAQQISTRPVLAPPKDAANLTNAEKMARYEHWTGGAAQGGRYEVKGTTLYRYPYLAKNQSGDIIERNKSGNLGTGVATGDVTFSNNNNTFVLAIKSADGKSETRRTFTRLE
jgi:hypothetical protein